MKGTSASKTEWQKGRGAQKNTNNQFSQLDVDPNFFTDLVDEEEMGVSPKTQYIEVHPKTIVNKVPSPDIGLNWSINPYQGCEHGCVYCYARSTHEYWGYSAGAEFEQKILYKPSAPQLLRQFFDRKHWKPDTIMLSGNTDCYQPAERKFKITRQLLEVFNEYQNPVGMITKNSLILRDLDIIQDLASKGLVAVVVSLTTLNETTRRALEPRTASGKQRLKTIKTLSDAGVPVIAQMGPVIPGLTDHEIPEVIKAAADHGATKVTHILVRLNGVIGDIFEDWVHKAFPEKAERILSNIKSIHGGKLNENRYKTRMTGEGNMAEAISQLFKMNQKKYFSETDLPPLRTDLFKRPGKGQLDLFG